MAPSFRRVLVALVAIVVHAPGLGAQAPSSIAPRAAAGLESISAADLKRHLFEIASDAYEGRLTATPGHERAVAYVAKHFADLGLEPYGEPGDDGKRSFLQGYDVTLMGVSPKSVLSSADGKRLHDFGAWFLPARRRNAENELELTLDAPLELVGRLKRGALEGRDLSGVIPVAIIDLDSSRDDRMTVMDAMMQGPQRELGYVRSAAAQFASAGAPAGIVLTGRFNLAFKVAANMTGMYPSKPLVNLGNRPGAGAMGLMAPSPRIPILVLDGADAEKVLAAIGGDAEKALARGGAAAGNAGAGNGNGAPEGDGAPAAPRMVSKERFTLHVGVTVETKKALNVVGLLRGRDPALAAEAILYSAHSDHVGMGPDGQAFNGADDDGSGTVSLLELAEAFARLPEAERPRRSVLFVSVSGEELGLWGSAHYAKNPTWPIDQTIANINIDMIGRSTEAVPETMIAVTPTFRHREYSTLAREAAAIAKEFGLELGNGDRFYERSDHYNFARRGVPVVFFCDDEHADYHLPTDDPEKIEYEKMERVVRLAYRLGFRTADRDGRPERLGKKSSFEDPSGTAPGDGK